MINKIKKRKILLLRPKGEIVEGSGHLRAIRPPYLLKYSEALLKQNDRFDVNLIDCLIEKISPKTLDQRVLSFDPDIICIYQLSIDESFTRQFINEVCKNINPLIVLCGQGVLGANVDPKNFPGHDVIILKGEAEEAVGTIADEVDSGMTHTDLINKFNTSSRLLVNEPGQLPHPKYSIKELSKYSFFYPLKYNRSLHWGHILSGRGCPYGCTFCSPVMRESYGSSMRLRDAKGVVDEIVYQKELGVNIFSFDDDDFTADRDHVRAICNELIDREVNLPWIVHARVDEVDEEILHLMKRAGCALLRFGIESASERILLKLHKGNPRRWIAMTREAFKKAHAIGIGTVALFFIGAPDEEAEDVEASISLAKELDPDILQVSFFTPYPGSKIYEEVKESLNNADMGRLYHYAAPLYNFSRIDTQELVHLQKRFYREVIFRRVFLINHIKKFHTFYMRNLHLTFSLFNGALRTVTAKI